MVSRVGSRIETVTSGFVGGLDPTSTSKSASTVPSWAWRPRKFTTGITTLRTIDPRTSSRSRPPSMPRSTAMRRGSSIESVPPCSTRLGCPHPSSAVSLGSTPSRSTAGSAPRASSSGRQAKHNDRVWTKPLSSPFTQPDMALDTLLGRSASGQKSFGESSESVTSLVTGQDDRRAVAMALDAAEAWALAASPSPATDREGE